jgi:hypothetical protein
MTPPAADGHLADLRLDPNEASGLVSIGAPELLDRNGWDRGFWTVLDDTGAAECLVLLGHEDGADVGDGWHSHRLSGRCVGYEGEVEDAEAVAIRNGYVYVFGSHHGHKSGPLRTEVQWVARFAEADVEHGDEESSVQLHVVHTQLKVHRLINDALRDSGLDLLPMSDHMSSAFIEDTIDELRGTPMQGAVEPHDWTVNIEGADFTADGDVLLGLRFPVSAEGAPVIVQLSGWDSLFEDPMALPSVEAIWQVDAIGRKGTLAGVRDLCTVDDAVHLVTGDLDSAGKGSIIREDYEGGTQTVSTHFEATLPGRTGGRVTARAVREFPDNPRIEGIAVDDDGRFFYVSDEDESVRLRTTPLFTG